MQQASLLKLQRLAQAQQGLEANFSHTLQQHLQQHTQRLEQAQLPLQLLDPRLVLQRGYALLHDSQGRSVTHIAQAPPGSAVRAQVMDGVLDLTVVQPRLL